ncbi:MAG: hypothetical protein ACKOMX_07515 [Actinomycetota bacterium]
MASRSSAPARNSRGTSTRRPATKPAAKPAARPKAKASARSASARRPAPRSGPGPVARMLAALGRAIRAVWLGIAGAIGGAARRIGSDARDLDDVHRRDGLGLLFVALAVITAAAVWFGVDGWFTVGLGTVSSYLVGAFDLFVPVILLVMAWRTLRAPEDHVTNGRLLVGGLALLIAAAGIWHLIQGLPTPSDGLDALSSGAGIVGWVATAPIAAALGPVVAGVLLGLLAIFGLLVITGTPLIAVPRALKAGLGHLMRSGSGRPVD